MVVAGSLSAFSFLTPYGRLGIAPLVFLRKLLCMSAGRVARPTCKTKVDLDAVSIHPWTSGSPIAPCLREGRRLAGRPPRAAATGRRSVSRRSHSAQGSAGHMDHGVRLGHATPRYAIRSPPRSRCRPAGYPRPSTRPGRTRSASSPGSSCGTSSTPSPCRAASSSATARISGTRSPKPAFYAFRFPFVAYRNGRTLSVWGTHAVRTPGRVAVQRKTAAGWRWMGTLTGRPLRDLPGICALPETAEAVGPFQPAPPQRQHVPRCRRVGETDVVLAARRARGTTASRRDAQQRRRVHGGRELGVKGPCRGRRRPLQRQDGARQARPDRPGSTRSSSGRRRGRKRRRRVQQPQQEPRVRRLRRVRRHGALVRQLPDLRAPVGNGAWHHLVYTYDTATSTGRIYVDGKLSQLAVWQRLEGGADASIAFDASLRHYFGGQIAQVAVYPYVLSPAQVKSHYQATGRRVAPDTPLGFLRALQVGSEHHVPSVLSRPPTRPLRPALRPRRDPAIGRPAEEG